MENKIENLATKQDYAKSFKNLNSNLKRLILCLFIVLFLMVLGLYFRD
jgi:hypothetical protein